MVRCPPPADPFATGSAFAGFVGRLALSSVREAGGLIFLLSLLLGNYFWVDVHGKENERFEGREKLGYGTLTIRPRAALGKRLGKRGFLLQPAATEPEQGCTAEQEHDVGWLWDSDRIEAEGVRLPVDRAGGRDLAGVVDAIAYSHINISDPGSWQKE